MNYYFKVLGEDRNPCHNGKGQWPLPGVWTEERDVVPCKSGWHLCRSRDLLSWFGPCLWLAEAEDVTECGGKVVARRARLIRQLPWNEKTARLFAADCAESALSNFESKYPDDDRPRKAIETARAYARAEVTKEELEIAYSAARSAARSATSSSAGSAARSAVYSTAYYSACSAARSAARSAAYSVPGSTAYHAAAMKEYTKLLIEKYLGLKAGW